MFYAATAKNLMLEAMDESIATGMKYGSLHTAFSTTGINEVTGGSPAYARKALTWGAAVAGVKSLIATLPIWDVPSATTVPWIGFWDAVTVGNFLGMGPNGGSPLKRFAVPTGDLATDVIEAPAHGFVNGDTVVLWAASGGPAGLAVGTIYFVVSATTDTLKLALTAGGSAIDVTAIGTGFLQKILVQSFVGQGLLTVSSLSIDLNAVA